MVVINCCCTAKEEKTKNKDSLFDAALIHGYQSALQDPGNFDFDPRKTTRGQVHGTLGLVKQFNDAYTAERLAHEYSTNFSADVMAEADPGGQSFATAGAGQVVVNEAGADQRLPLVALVHPAPLGLDHFVLAPGCASRHPQHMTREFLLYGLQLLQRSTRLDFRLLFNSLGTCPAANHFHYHGLYLDQVQYLSAKFPVEDVGRSNIAGQCKQGGVTIDMLHESTWYMRGFVLSAGSKVGAAGKDPPADIEVLATVAMRLISMLQVKNVPHRLLLCPPPPERKRARGSGRASLGGGRPGDAAAGGAGAAEEASSPEIYILPQRPGSARPGGGPALDASAAGAMGIISACSAAEFQAVTEESVRAYFMDAVSLPDKDFDELICDFAWFGVTSPVEEDEEVADYACAIS